MEIKKTVQNLSYYPKPYHPIIGNEISLRRDINEPHEVLFLAGSDCIDSFKETWPDHPAHSIHKQMFCEFDQHLQPEIYAWPSHGIDVAILTGGQTGALECRLKNAVLDGYLANSVQCYQFEFHQWHGPVWFSPVTTLQMGE